MASANTSSTSVFSFDESPTSISDESVTETGRCRGRGRGRGRGQRGRGSGSAEPTVGRGRGQPASRRGRGRGRAAPSVEDEERVEGLQRQRRETTERLLQEMTLEDYRTLTEQLLERQPGLIFDVLMERQNKHGVPAPAGIPGVPWCTCGHCRDMPTDRERKCCGQDPAYCVSMLPHFSQYCLDEGFLRIHRQYREDITALGQAREPGADHREYRHAAYRHFIFWQHGSLGQGNRRVIPSCCVWRIRDKFPDPQGHYIGYVPSI